MNRHGQRKIIAAAYWPVAILAGMALAWTVYELIAVQLWADCAQIAADLMIPTKMCAQAKTEVLIEELLIIAICSMLLAGMIYLRRRIRRSTYGQV